jgi:hypothetical protein
VLEEIFWSSVSKKQQERLKMANQTLTIDSVFCPKGKPVKIDMQYAGHWVNQDIPLGELRIINDEKDSIFPVGPMKHLASALQALIISLQHAPNDCHTNAPVRCDGIFDLFGMLQDET